MRRNYLTHLPQKIKLILQLFNCKLTNCSHHHTHHQLSGFEVKLNLHKTVFNEMKRKRATSANSKSTSKCRKEDPENPVESCSFHTFPESDVSKFREHMLAWYDGNKRDLPWRHLAKREDPNERAYAVWVSEIMLQQTQVATVIDYYNKWMKKWPTLEALAEANLEEVNEMWAGLGYYSRGRRLHEGAQKLVNELKGQMPNTSSNLSKELPGVGRYTAAAIASIAFGEPCGLVDGNVIRVFARMQCIGANSTNPAVLESIWSLANKTVDPERSGDFNQSLMELGATVCTPKAPSCSTCPVQSLCKAKMKVDHNNQQSTKRLVGKDCQNGTPDDIPDIECVADNCHLCLPKDEKWDKELGVMNYPRKPKKKPQREERTAVCIIKNQKSPPDYLIVQRPQTGLLAGLWEFPSIIITNENTDKKHHQPLMDDFLHTELGMKFDQQKGRRHVAEVVHIFSHIHQTYVVETFTAVDNNNDECPDDCKKPWRWVTKQQFLESAVSTAMKKVFKACEQNKKTSNSNEQKPLSSQSSGKKQLGLAAFFKPVPKQSK